MTMLSGGLENGLIFKWIELVWVGSVTYAYGAMPSRYIEHEQSLSK